MINRVEDVENEISSCNQRNIYPIINWSIIDIWLYIFSRNIDFNDAYRLGFRKVGCSCMCPLNDDRTQFLYSVYCTDLFRKWNNLMTEFANEIGEINPVDYVSSGKWKIAYRRNKKKDVFYDSFLKSVKLRCDSNIKIITEQGKCAIKIEDYNLALYKFSDCRRKLEVLHTVLTKSVDIADRLRKDDFLYSRISSLKVCKISELVDILNQIILDEKKSATIDDVLELDESEIEIVIDNARRNILNVKNFISELNDLNEMIEQT